MRNRVVRLQFLVSHLLEILSILQNNGQALAYPPNVSLIHGTSHNGPNVLGVGDGDNWQNGVRSFSSPDYYVAIEWGWQW